MRFDPNAVISGAGGPAVGYFAVAVIIPARFAIFVFCSRSQSTTKICDWVEASGVNRKEVTISGAFRAASAVITNQQRKT